MRKGSSILDVGCGNAQALDYFKDQYDCKGIDKYPQVQDDRIIETHKEAAHKRANYNKTTGPKKPITKVYSMRELIYGDVCDTIRILVGDLVRLERPVFTQGVINILNAFGREDIAKTDLVDKVIDEYKYHDKVANEEEDNAKI